MHTHSFVHCDIKVRFGKIRGGEGGGLIEKGSTCV
jgi:hypothetical protein